MQIFHHKTRFFLFILIAILLASCTNKPTKQNLLIITGGHDFERDAFFDVFDNMPGITYKEIIQPEANKIYASPQIDSFDVLLFYDMVEEISKEQKAAFIELLEKGKGIVFMHHALVSYQHWDEFEKIIGGHFYRANDSLGIEESTYRHDVEIPVTVVDKNHPVTNGLSDFTIHDEVYGNLNVIPTIHPLLTTNHPESEKNITWTNHYSNSRIVYIQLGHDQNAYQDLNFRILVKQAIEWVDND